MSLEIKEDSCLVSQEIRDLIEKEAIIANPDDSNIQPSSFEPTIGSEAYILDSEGGLFRPKEDQTVYKTLLELPKRKRQKIDISKGFEVKKGYSYLIKLYEKIKKDSTFQFIVSSPKSSIGRLFFNTRLLADYNSSFDEVHNFTNYNDHLNLWLLLQPLAFNAIINPGLTFNQLRFLQVQELS